jgi:16S rRNA (adenine1518-N6/adenine1519-N6)-dimethyltransferase
MHLQQRERAQPAGEVPLSQNTSAPSRSRNAVKLSEMRDTLAARGIQLTKSLGQNFLHDHNQLRRIVKAADLSCRDKVLEIGPGLGPLTELLVAQGCGVLAIEKDARLVELLRERFHAGQVSNSYPSTQQSGMSARPALQLLHDDALEFLRRERRDWSGWKLVANLPYSVAAPMIVQLAQPAKCPERMVVTLQLEVAQRLMAGPGAKDYGILTLLIRLDYEPRDWFKIPASCFFPQPDVDSACVTLTRRAEPLLADVRRQAYASIVKRAFSQRRKMMSKLLREDWPEDRLRQALAELGVSRQARAEYVSLEQFVGLTEVLAA